jgi:hypothetical protein
MADNAVDGVTAAISESLKVGEAPADTNRAEPCQPPLPPTNDTVMPTTQSSPPDANAAPTSQENEFRLFIGDLGPKTTDVRPSTRFPRRRAPCPVVIVGFPLSLLPCPLQASLRQYFETYYGPVEKATVKHPHSRRHTSSYEHARSFGFISVFDHDLCQAILEATRTEGRHIIDGHQAGKPELAKPVRSDSKRSTRSSTPSNSTSGSNNASRGGAWAPNGMWEQHAPCKIFVGGLSSQTKEQALYVRLKRH